MENVINLVAYFIGSTVTKVTDEQRAQLELAYAQARAVHNTEPATLIKRLSGNDAEVDELLTHWGLVKEGK